MSKALQKKPIDTLKAIIHSDSVQEQFKNAMGRHSDLFVASLIDVFSDGLQDCDPAGVVQQALKAAVLKLPISKGLGFAYLVPYKKKAQFQIGYKGMIQLAMRSGQVSALNGGPVFEGEFKSNDRMTGKIDISGEAKSEKVAGYFVYMELINGFKKSEYWSKEKVIEFAKKKSQSYGNSKSAWASDFDAMATKTVLKSVLSKYAPMSIDFVAALSSDEPESKPDADGLYDPVPDNEPGPSKDQIKAAKKEAEKAAKKSGSEKPKTDGNGNEIIDIDPDTGKPPVKTQPNEAPY